MPKTSVLPELIIPQVESVYLTLRSLYLDGRVPFSVVDVKHCVTTTKEGVQLFRFEIGVDNSDDPKENAWILSEILDIAKDRRWRLGGLQVYKTNG